MTASQHDLIVPDLGLGEEPITLCEWLVESGQRVHSGDRLVELLAGAAAIDLPSPITGTLAKKLVPSDQRVCVGQRIGILLVDD